MKLKLSLRYIFISILFLILVVGCQRRTFSSELSPTNTPENLIDQSVFNSQNEPIIPTDNPNIQEQIVGEQDSASSNSTNGQTESFVPEYTPTPDLRLPPERWKDWPVIPEVSPNAVAIYKNGIAMGNDPHHFSKIGDCQFVKAVMGLYDLPGRYTLTAENQYLQETIDNFSGSFNRDGMAVKGGFNAATVLSPIWADPEFCEPGENPIQCEFRIHKPTMVLISLEVWWDGRSPERYEQYMRRIIEYSIEQGIVPILSTKADNVEGDHSINYTTAKLAYEYDIPLWNFWLAVQDLPYQGIDPDRDGFHISVDAWNRRSFTALQSLYAVLQTSLNSEGQETSEESVVVQDVSPEVSSLFFETDKVDLHNLEGTLIFELAETIDGKVLPAGIYSLNLDNGQLSRIFNAGTQIISENHSNGFIVMSDDDYSYVRPDGSILPITGNDLSDGQIFLFSDDGILLAKSNSTGELEFSFGKLFDNGTIKTSSLNVTGVTEPITAIHAATRDILIVSVGDCQTDECQFISIENYQSDEEINVIEMVAFDHPSLQMDSGLMAFWREINDTDSLHLIDLKYRGREQYLGLFGNVFLDQSWKNNSNSVAVIKMERSDYYGRATEILHYVVDASTKIVKEYTSAIGLNPRITWSPDDQYLVTSITQVDEAGNSTIVLRIVNTITQQEILLDAELGLTSDTHIAITELIWLD